MIIPVIYTLDPVCENLSQLWCFFKAVNFSLCNHSLVIAQEQYFTQRVRQEQVLPQFFRQDLAKKFDYVVPSTEDVENVCKVIIPQEIEQRYIVSYGTQSDAYVACFKENWKELEDYLVEKLIDAEKKMGEKIEAFTCLLHFKFMENIAQRLNVPVIYYEWGPFRYSNYRDTAYFFISDSIVRVKEVCEEFKSKGFDKQVPVLTNKEILAIQLEADKLIYLVDKQEEKYEVGIIGSYNSITAYTTRSRQNLLEVYNELRKKFSSSQIAVRYHPGDPLHVKMGVENEIEGNLIDFIQSCKRVVCLGSNVEYEALLFDKQVYDQVEFIYHGIVNSDLRHLSDQSPDSVDLNVIAFVILIPFELLKDIDYIRYRLSNPSLKDIYLYHLNYYLDQLKIPQKILEIDDFEQRFNEILLKRKEHGKEVVFSIEELSKRNSELTMQNNELFGQNNQLSMQNNELLGQNNQLNAQNDELLGQNNELLGQNNQLSMQNNGLTLQVEELKQQIISKQQDFDKIVNNKVVKVALKISDIFKVR